MSREMEIGAFRVSRGLDRLLVIGCQPLLPVVRDQIGKLPHPQLAIRSYGVVHALRCVTPYVPQRGRATLIGEIRKPENVVEAAKIQGRSVPKLVGPIVGIAGRAVIEDRVKRIRARVGDRDSNSLVAMTGLVVPTSLECRSGT